MDKTTLILSMVIVHLVGGLQYLVSLLLSIVVTLQYLVDPHQLGVGVDHLIVMLITLLMRMSETIVVIHLQLILKSGDHSNTTATPTVARHLPSLTHIVMKIYRAF